MIENFIKTANISREENSTIYDGKLREYMISVYNNMGLALLTTAIVSFFIVNSSLIRIFYANQLMAIISALLPFGFVIYFSAKMNSLSFEQARRNLFIFAGLMAISLSPIFLIYTGESIVRVFLISASLFGVMSLYGYTTKKDLTSMGSFMVMGLFGVIIASLINLFLKSPAISFAVSFLAVIIFTALTAYDVQKIKENFYRVSSHEESVKKAAILGALTLYIDLINLFIHLLHLLGNRR